MDGSGQRTFVWEQPVSMPSYLVALAVGELEARDISPRWVSGLVVLVTGWYMKGKWWHHVGLFFFVLVSMHMSVGLVDWWIYERKVVAPSSSSSYPPP